MRMQFQRMCSALLAVVLSVTAVPGTQLTSYAAETAKENSIVTNAEEELITMEEVGLLNLRFTCKGMTEKEMQEVLEQVKVQNAEGMKEYDVAAGPVDAEVVIPLYREYGETFTFHLEMPEGYTTASVRLPKAIAQGQPVRVSRNYSSNNYTLRSRDSGTVLEGEYWIEVVFQKIKDSEIYVESSDTIETVEVLYNDEKVDVTDGFAKVSNAGGVTVKVKPKLQENQIVKAQYEAEGDGAPGTYEESYIEDGFYYYEIGKVNSDTSMLFTTVERVNINLSVDDGISGYETAIDVNGGITLENGAVLTTEKDKTVQFILYFDEEKLNANELVITASLEDGTISEIPLLYDSDMCEYRCHYQVADNSELSFQWVPRKAYKVNFETENVSVYQCSYDEEMGECSPGEEYPKDTELSIYEGRSITFAVKVGWDFMNTFEVTPTGKTEDALECLTMYDPGEEYYYYVYRYTPTQDTTLYVKETPIEEYHVALECENAAIYSAYVEDEQYYISDAWEDRNVSTGNTVLFAVKCDNTKKIESVKLVNGGENKIKYVSSISDSNEGIYYVYSYLPTEDTTISVNVVEKDKYILTFEAENATVELSDGQTTWDSASEYELYEGEYLFFVTLENETDRVKLVTATSDTTQMENRTLVPYYSQSRQQYYYRVKLSADTTVTVVTEEKELHEVELSGQNVDIENVTGSFANTDTGYSVYDGETFSFQVAPQEGYEISQVNVTGDNGRNLYPVSNGESNVYAVKVGKDMAIQVETVQKEVSTVTFEKNNAVVFSENPVDEEGNYIAYKGEPFVFTVEAAEGYVLETVSANGEELEPIYEPYSDTCYYQIETEEDITVSVSVSAPESKEISFSNGEFIADGFASCWSESGKTYTSVDGTITVSSNEILWFDVPNPSWTAEVRCIGGYSDSGTDGKILHRTCHNGRVGYYLGNVTEDMIITIVTGDTYEVTFESLRAEEKFMPLTGIGTYPETIYVPSGESFDFKVAVQEDYTLYSVAVRGAVKKTGSLETGIYHIEPRKDGSVNIQAKSRKLAQAEYTFDYPSEEVSMAFFVNEEEISLVNKAVVLPNTESITVKITPLKDKVIELCGSGSSIIEPDVIEEDGTLVYELNNSMISGVSDGHLRVDASDYHTIEFAGENGEVLVGMIDENGDYIWNEIENSVKVKEDANLIFRVNLTEGYRLADIEAADETAGEIMQKTGYDYNDDTYYTYYQMVPAKDTVINFTTEQLPGYDYHFVYDASKVDLYMGHYSYYMDEWDYEIVWDEEPIEYNEFRKAVTSDVRNKVMFQVYPKDGYIISSVSTNREDENLCRADDVNAGMYYWLPNTQDTTITIAAEEIASYDVTFELGDGITYIDVTNYDGRDFVVNNDNKTINVTNEYSLAVYPYIARKELTDGSEYQPYIIKSIVAQGCEVEQITDEEGSIYYALYGLRQAATVKFETEVNTNFANTTTFVVNGDKEALQAYHYVEIEDEDGNVERKKEYLDLDKELYLFDRSDAIGLEAAEGYEIGTVEFKRGDKVKTLTPNEEGLYPIWYPFSMGLEGSFEVSVYSEKVAVESAVIPGITEGKVSLDVDTVKEYEVTFAPADANLSRIGVEVIPKEGQPANNVQAEIIDGKLRLTTAPVTACENAAIVKIYDVDAKTGEKVYIEGGSFTVSAMRPTALEEGSVKAEVLSINDAAVKLRLTAPEGLNELNAGMYYYKVQIVPQEKEGYVPEEIQSVTETPYYLVKNGANAQIQLPLNANGVGKGQEWSYEIKVSMVQTTDRKGLGDIASKELFKSKQETFLNVKTRNPYYQEQVTFKNQIKKVYTAQKNIAAAEVIFEENNSNPQVAGVKDITELNGKGSALTVWEENGVIYATVSENTMEGKHTIEVTLDAPENMKKAQGTFQLNVVKGIETIDVMVPSVSIYKQANKAITLKVTPVYNQQTTAPKIQKVNWQIVKANGEAFSKTDALYEMVTVKNGKVTVNKNYVPSENVSDNQFRVKALAADYKENTVYGLSEVITLSSKPIEIGAIYLMTPVEGGYQAEVRNTITSDILENAFVAAFKEKIEENRIYTKEELKLLGISSENLTYKISNKAVTVQTGEMVTLNAAKTAKNVKLTVTANDGSKKKAEMKFTIVYAEPKALALEIGNGNQILGEIAAKEISFAGTTNTRLTIKVKQKIKDSWTDLNALVNYKLSIKGGKMVSSDTVKGIYEIIVTGKKATVKLDNKTTGAKDTYQIINTAYSEGKAPKVKTTEKLICGVKAGRSITYKLSGKYDDKNKYVLVETDVTGKNKKTEANYNQFESAATNLNTLIPITAEGKFTINFNENPIPAGSYKLKLTFGAGTGVEDFAAYAKPVTVTLKAVKPKVTKGSYAPVKSYKIEGKAGEGVMLNGKGKNLVENSLVYFDLKNANIKGKQNDFLSYFELKDGKLLLSSDVTEEEIAYLKSKGGKNDLTAYISYTVAYGDDGYGNPFTTEKTIKLTIKLK